MQTNDWCWIKFIVLDSNTWNHLTGYKWFLAYLKMLSTNYLFTNHIFNIYKEDMALNNLQGLICHKKNNQPWKKKDKDTFILKSLFWGSRLFYRPVGWGCRIRRLHLCRGVRPPPPMSKALGRIPGGWAVIDLVTEWSMACNTSLWPLLGLTVGRIGPDPINQLVMSSPSIYIFYPDRTFKSALAASSQPLSVSC